MMCNIFCGDYALLNTGKPEGTCGNGMEYKKGPGRVARAYSYAFVLSASIPVQESHYLSPGTFLAGAERGRARAFGYALPTAHFTASS